MATIAGTTPARRVPMSPLRRTALIAGALYLITFVAGIPPALALYGDLLTDPAYILGSGGDTRVLLGGFLDLVNAVAAIGTAVVLFPVVKRQSETAALGFVTARLFEGMVITVGVLSLFALVTLRQGTGVGTDAAALVAVGQSLVAVRDWTHLLGPGLVPPVNALLLGYLMYRSGLVPRPIPTMGLIGAPLLLAANTATMFGLNHRMSLWTGLATIPIFFWELSLGLYMAFKGFRPSPITVTRPEPFQSHEPIAVA